MSQEKPSTDPQAPVLEALFLLLSDLSTTRFDLLITLDREPLEAAQEVIDSLERYDFLAGSVGSEARYEALKKGLESRISDRADGLIREQNPR